MSDKLCGRPAISLFPWGGKVYQCCAEHTRRFKILNDAIGGVQKTKSFIGGKCEMPSDLEETTNE